MRSNLKRPRVNLYSVFLFLILAMVSSSAFAQGSIFGTVTNSDLSVPANGEISFFGYLDNTDEEIRIESSSGAGYDAGNWFDDFQNYLTEAAGNPYDYHFVNTTNGESFHLAGSIPANSFQQENVALSAVAIPTTPTGLAGSPISSTSVLLSWDFVSGSSYHVYRRPAASNGSFFRIDNPAGSMTDFGETVGYFVDATTDGVSSYQYLIVADDGAGNLSAHSAIITVNAGVFVAPVLTSIDPTHGTALGGTTVTVNGSGFDPAGVTVQFGATPASATVLSPYLLSVVVPAGTAGAVDVSVTNVSSGLTSNVLTGGFLYDGNSAPVLAAIGPQSVDEGANLNFGVTATDADLTTPVLTTSALPPNATFIDNGNGTGTFDFNPDFTQSGTINVTFYATDQAAAIDSEIVTITVNQVNLAPVLAAIGAQTVDEGANLNFGVSATDADGTIPVLTTSTLPANATFTDNGNGTGTFDFNPDYTQAGTINVTFYATDDSTAVDSEIVTITVNQVNLAPVLAAIGAQTVDEGANLNFSVSATDADGTIPVLTTSTLPTNATFTDNGDGTGTFDFNPDYTQAGSISVTFYATDDSTAVDSEIVTITVNQVNLAPVLAAIGPKSVEEGANLNFGVSASDADGTIPVLSTSILPANATFTDNGDGTGTFDFNPDFTQSGVHVVTFYATDDSLAYDSEAVTITVGQFNLPPVLATIGPKSVDEGANLNFAVSATDGDGTIPVLTTSTLPPNATFVDNGDGSGTFDFNPDYTQAGTVDVTFYATDDSLAVDSEIVTITINQTNLAPVLAAIGPQLVTEGNLLTFGASASDFDGDTPVLSTSALPGTAAFLDNGDGTGTFTWQTGFTDAGSYDVTFYATDALDNTLIDSEIVTITVNDAGNQTPVLAAINDTTIVEGSSLSLTVSATDADGEFPSLSATTTAANTNFVDNGDGTGLFTFNPDLTQAGVYTVVFKAIDLALAVDSQVVTITVNETNQAPVLALPGTQNGTEAVLLAFTISATDGDGTIPVLTATNVPAGATFIDSLNGVGSFEWTPSYTDSGSYDVVFHASDGIDADSGVVTLVIADAGNQAPVIAAVGPQAVLEGGNLNFVVTALDPDGTTPTMSAVGLPLNATFLDNGDGTGTFDFSPSFSQAGSYNVTFIADDGALADSQIVNITVTESGNQAPIFAALVDTSVAEGGTLVINVSATDPDGGGLFPTLSVSTTLNNYTFVDNNDGTGVLSYTPNFFDAGIDSVVFFAVDFGTPQQTGSVSIIVTTTEVNQAPTWVASGPWGVSAGDTLEFTVIATDSTDPVLTHRLYLSAQGLPANATFTDNTNGTGLFRFVPTTAQAGIINVSFLAVDQGTPQLSATLPVEITVVKENIPPVIDPIPPQVVTEGEILIVNISANDPDSSAAPVLTATIPDNSTFVDNGDGTAVFTFFPNYVQSGLVNLAVRASDAYSTTKVNVLIQVYEAGDQQPVFDPLPTPSVVEADSIQFTVAAHDPDELPVALTVTAATMPAFVQFADSGNGVGLFTAKPGYTDAGSYDLEVIASDGTLSDTAVVTLEVIEAGNQLPVIAPIGDQTGKELIPLAFSIYVFDIDGSDYPLISGINMPSGAVVTDNRDGSGLFSWTPTDLQAGVYDIAILAEDFDFPTVYDTEYVTITIADTNRLPLIVTSGSRTMYEGDTIKYAVYATDPDGTIPLLRARTDGETDLITPNMTFYDSANGTGVLTFTPDYTQGGTSSLFYYVRFYARDAADTTLVKDATAPVQIEVIDRNAPPTVMLLGGPGPFTITEGENLTFNVGAEDIDGVSLPILSAINLPANATFTGLQSFGTFSFTPSFTQAGTYQVTFRAIDDQGATDEKTVQIDVVEAGNQAPYFTTIPLDTVNIPINQTSQVLVRAFDPDLNAMTLAADPIWTTMFANFVDSGNGSGVYSVAPETQHLDSVYQVRFIVTDPSGLADTVITQLRCVTFLRGDLDANNRYTMNDLAWLISYLFRDGPAPDVIDAADVDKNGDVNIADITFLIKFLYYSGPQPPQ